MNLLYNDHAGQAPSLEAYFAVEPDYPPEVIADGQRMVALLHHLQQNIPGPDLRVSIQMFGLWFYHPDYAGGVRVEPRNQLFRVSYPVPDTWSGWDEATVVGATDSVAIATTMLFSAFQHLPHPNHWRHHMLETHGIRAKPEPQDLEQLHIQLRRISQQKNEPIQAYYQALNTHSGKTLRYGAERMSALLTRILDETSPRMYWCYTEDASLTLTENDTWEAGVTIRPVSKFGYQISFPLEAHRAPWKQAQIEGNTTSLDEAIHMTAVALQRLYNKA